MTGKQNKPLSLDMAPDEALARFIGVDPDDLPGNVRLRKGKGAAEAAPRIKPKVTKDD